MISRLRGKLIEKQPPTVLLEIMGTLTYEVLASMHTFYQLPALGEEILLYTQFIVREEGHYLYGFFDITERLVFNQLLKVNGVGPKVALSILSKIEASELMACVEQQDKSALQAVPGIGQKTAERLIIEMRDRLAPLKARFNKPPDSSCVLIKSVQQDAIAALIALGYKSQEAHRAILRIKDKNFSLESLIRRALETMH